MDTCLRVTGCRVEWLDPTLTRCIRKFDYSYEGQLVVQAIFATFDNA